MGGVAANEDGSRGINVSLSEEVCVLVTGNGCIRKLCRHRLRKVGVYVGVGVVICPALIFLKLIFLAYAEQVVEEQQ